MYIHMLAWPHISPIHHAVLHMSVEEAHVIINCHAKTVYTTSLLLNSS